MAQLTEETMGRALSAIEKYRDLQILASQEMTNSVTTSAMSEEETLALIGFLQQSNQAMIPEPELPQEEKPKTLILDETRKELIANWEDYSVQMDNYINSADITQRNAERLLDFLTTMKKLKNEWAK
jgi:hypothetical protein